MTTTLPSSMALPSRHQAAGSLETFLVPEDEYRAFREWRSQRQLHSSPSAAHLSSSDDRDRRKRGRAVDEDGQVGAPEPPESAESALKRARVGADILPFARPRIAWRDRVAVAALPEFQWPTAPSPSLSLSSSLSLGSAALPWGDGSRVEGALFSPEEPAGEVAERRVNASEREQLAADAGVAVIPWTLGGVKTPLHDESPISSGRYFGGFVGPVTSAAALLEAKVYVPRNPAEEFATAENIVGHIIGADGQALRELEKASGCRISVRGHAVGIGEDDLHLFVQADSETLLATARRVIDRRFQELSRAVTGIGFADKIFLDEARFAKVENIVGKIIGKGGSSLQELEKNTRCFISVRGLGVAGVKEGHTVDEPMHLFVRAQSQSDLLKARRVIATRLSELVEGSGWVEYKLLLPVQDFPNVPFVKRVRKKIKKMVKNGTLKQTFWQIGGQSSKIKIHGKGKARGNFRYEQNEEDPMHLLLRCPTQAKLDKVVKLIRKEIRSIADRESKKQRKIEKAAKVREQRAAANREHKVKMEEARRHREHKVKMEIDEARRLARLRAAETRFELRVLQGLVNRPFLNGLIVAVEKPAHLSENGRANVRLVEPPHELLAILPKNLRPVGAEGGVSAEPPVQPRARDGKASRGVVDPRGFAPERPRHQLEREQRKRESLEAERDSDGASTVPSPTPLPVPLVQPIPQPADPLEIEKLPDYDLDSSSDTAETLIDETSLPGWVRVIQHVLREAGEWVNCFRVAELTSALLAKHGLTLVPTALDMLRLFFHAPGDHQGFVWVSLRELHRMHDGNGLSNVFVLPFKQRRPVFCAADCMCARRRKSSFAVEPSPTSMPSNYGSMWIQSKTDQDEVYYWNSETKESVWSEPAEWRYAVLGFELSGDETARVQSVLACLETLGEKLS